MRWSRLFIVLAAALLPVTLPAGRMLRLRPPLRADHDQSPIAEPKQRDVSESYAIVYNSWLRHLSPEYKASRAADPGALNANAWDEVPDSSWFAARIGLRSRTFAEIEAGLNATGAGPSPGSWTVTKIEDEGYTPKIDIIDPQGRKYVLKFDLPSAIERNSAAERICTLILHAAGYNVPHNSIAYFRREDLKLGADAKYSNAKPADRASNPIAMDAHRPPVCSSRPAAAAASRPSPWKSFSATKTIGHSSKSWAGIMPRAGRWRKRRPPPRRDRTSEIPRGGRGGKGWSAPPVMP